jgi:SAM-dependent methyltransferase
VTGYDPYVEEFSDDSALQSEYDVVLSLEVIEHVVEPREHARQIASRVRPGGFVAIATLSAEKIDLNRPARAAFQLHQPYHQHTLSHDVLVEIGRRNGLRQLSMSPATWDSYWPAVSERFFFEFTRAHGNVVDCQVEPLHWGVSIWAGNRFFSLSARLMINQMAISRAC